MWNPKLPIHTVDEVGLMRNMLQSLTPLADTFLLFIIDLLQVVLKPFQYVVKIEILV